MNSRFIGAAVEAIEMERLADLEALLSEGLDPNSYSEDARLSLLGYALDLEMDVAAQSGRELTPRASLLLLRYGADPNRVVDGFTAWDLAAERGYAAFLKLRDGLNT